MKIVLIILMVLFLSLRLFVDGMASLVFLSLCILSLGVLGWLFILRPIEHTQWKNETDDIDEQWTEFYQQKDEWYEN